MTFNNSTVADAPRVRHNKFGVVVAAAILLSGLVAAFGAPVTYLEDFNTGANGWFVDGAIWRSSGGVGNSGYLEGNRPGFSPNFGEHNVGNAGANTLGNLAALYGNIIQFSYQGKVFQGPVNLPPTQGFFSAGFSSFWSKVVSASIAPFEGNWAPVSFQIDTDWTDAEANANGWQREFGSDSWFDTLHNLGAQEVFYRLAHQSNASALFVTGLDDFRMESATASPCQPATIDSFSITPGMLDPKAIRLVPVQLHVVASDACGASVPWWIANITSSDGPTPLPSGRIEPDWFVRNGQLYLRAYRKTPGIARVYTVTIAVQDSSGDVATQDALVTVAPN